MENTLSHVAIAVSNITEATSFFELFSNEKSSDTKIVESQKVNTAFVPIGDTHIELLEPFGNDTSISSFLDKRGGGIHHVCIETDEFDKLIESVKSRGIRSLGEPSIGAKGRRVIFFHPKDTYNVLIELEER